VIRTSDNVVVGAAIPVGSGPNGVAVSLAGDYVYVANIGSGTVSVIATATNTVVQTVTVGTNPFNVAVVRLPTP
jgi:YVTN family beta-propeller protein